MGCQTSKASPDPSLISHIQSTNAHGSELGEIVVYMKHKCDCEIHHGDDDVELVPTARGWKASGLSAGNYDVVCFSNTAYEKISVQIRMIKSSVNNTNTNTTILKYKVTHASSDYSRDGHVEAVLSNRPMHASYLWTSGVVTTDPVLHDVHPGTYTCSIISNDETPLSYSHVCQPAIVHIRATKL